MNSVAEAITDPHADHEFGGRVKAFRTRAGLSLRDLSARTGLSVGMLSQIERNVTSPSLKTLTKLRIGLRVPLSALFDDKSAADEGTESRAYVRRKNARPKLDLGESMQKILLSPATAANLQLMLLVIAPRGGTSDTVVGVPGEKAALVMEGWLEITVGQETVVLEEGDTVQFNAETPHAFRNPGEVETKVLWVISQMPAERHI